MLPRIVEVTQPKTKIRFENELLVLELPDKPTFTVPINEVGTLLITQSSVSISGMVLVRLAELGVPLICCNERFLPIGALFSFNEHSRQSRFFIEQAKAALPLKKQLWKQIVQAKIKSQADLLRFYHLDDSALRPLLARVSSGDRKNLEGQAARLYWDRLALMPQRDRKAEDVNRLLNYAYTILFALAARAVCTAGLHPSLGIHHHNEYNPYCLASDLMESFRVAADEAVLVHFRETGSHSLDRETRQFLARAVTQARFLAGRRKVDIFSALVQSSVSLRHCFQKASQSLVLPEYILGSVPQTERGKN